MQISRSPTCLASSPGHSQILSHSFLHSCAIKSESGLGTRLLLAYIPYSAKFTRVFIHEFCYVSMICEVILMKILPRELHVSRFDCKSVNGQHPSTVLPNSQGTLSKCYLQYRHCFADSCELEQTTV